jgi:formylglycine-generating enzyme required for sulfatase activity
VLGADVEHACNQSENRRYATRWGPPVEAWISTFLLDRTEVTFAAYQACVRAGRCSPAKPAYRDFDRPDQPMVGLSWYQARDFCLAQGGRLPSEAEWERAARGPMGQATPFGDEAVSCAQAVVIDDRGRSCGVTKQHGQPEKGRTFVVASTPAGRYGVFDLVGNAEEWVDDWFTPDRAACAACQGEDPRGPCAGQPSCPDHPLKMVKGGSWYWEPSHATGWHRRPHFPSNQPYHHFGFRCAYDLPREEGP